MNYTSLKTRQRLSFLLRSCITHSAALQCHAQSFVQGLLPNAVLETDLLLVYSKLGLLRKARKVFDKMLDRRNMYSWNIMIASYAQHCMYYDVLMVFHEFKHCCLRPDHYTCCFNNSSIHLAKSFMLFSLFEIQL